MDPFKTIKPAIVLSGGGTRGAYEAGVLSYIRTQIHPELSKNMHFRIMVGSSVGAINAAFLAAYAHDYEAQGKMLAKLWSQIRTNHVYKRGPYSLSKFLLRTVLGTASHLMGAKGVAHQDDDRLKFQSLFDTGPFMQYLFENLPFGKISKNLNNHHVWALAVSATNVATGNLELFIEKNDGIQFSGHNLVQFCKISPRHVMASAALPVLFPPVMINSIYYNDGGLRLTTPLAPAVALGANRILIIGTRTDPKFKAQNLNHETLKPSLSEIFERFFAAIFIDRLETDKAQLDKINKILKAIESHCTLEQFQSICEQSKAYPIETLSINPSIDIAKLVDERLRNKYKRIESFGVLERSIIRLLEIDVNRGSEFLSYFLFEPTFIQELISLGFADAAKKHNEIEAFAHSMIEKP